MMGSVCLVKFIVDTERLSASRIREDIIKVLGILNRGV